MPAISTNLAANSAVRYLNINSASQTSSLAKLASGSRITQASDDAAGLAISTKISSDITALNQAATNASHGISVLQTADGGASNISDILQRMKALASQSASGTVTDNERVYIDAEFQQLVQEVDAISTGTRYNGQSLLDGTSAFAAGINVMVGSDAADSIKVALDKLTSQGLGLKTTDGIADGGIKGNKDTQFTAELRLGATGSPALLQAAAQNVLTFKINDVTVTLDAAAGDLDDVAIKAAIDAAMAAHAGEDFTIPATTPVWATGDEIVVVSSTVNAGGELKITDASGADLVSGSTYANNVLAALGLANVAAAESTGTGGVDGTVAELRLDETFTLADGVTMNVKINGVDIAIVGDTDTAGAGTLAGLTSVMTQISTQLLAAEGEDFTVSWAGTATDDIVIQSKSQGGQLTITNTDGTALSLAQAQSLKLGNAATYVAADATAVDAGTYGTVNDSPAMLNGGTGATITEDKVTFEVNGATVTLSKNGGANGDGKYTAQELVDTINSALLAANVTDVKASIRAGNLSIATTTTGATAKLEIDNFSSGTSKSILGMDPIATGVKAAEGEGTALEAGVQSAATQVGAVKALNVLDTAISQVSKARANIGSLESRFGFHQASIATSVENLTAAVSAIRDTDVAQEAAKLASSKVKTQAAVAAAAQASQMPQDLLRLLQ